MALNSKSVLTYGITVTTLNYAIDFKVDSGGSVLTAYLNIGSYSPSSLALEVAAQIQSAALTAGSSDIFTVSLSRNIMGGTQNRMTIVSNGSYFSLLFLTGGNTTITAAIIMGFNNADYTGALTYTGSATTGTSLIPDYIGYNYLDSNNMAKLFGAVNISSSGLKEAVTFSIQNFVEVEFKYEAKANLLAWMNFFSWAIQQKSFDFIPEILTPDTVYNVTLEKTQYHDQGLGYRMNEMLPEFPNFYQTGPLEFRIIANTSQFIL